MRKKAISFLAVLLIILGVTPAHAATADISAKSAILIHADSGRVLFEKDADAEMLIASTTKILTAIVVLEECELADKVSVGSESVGIEGSSMYLKAGEDYTVEQLLYGMMLASGNDAATALAIHAAGSVEAFAALMNEKAAALGMARSSFKNPHGLDEEGHYSTARDMAKLMIYCMENEAFAKIAATKSYKVGEQTYLNHNKLLSTYEGALCGKTGYTSSAGRSLVSAVERNGIRLVCVTISAQDDWNDHKKLCDRIFGNYSYTELIDETVRFSLPLVSGVKNSVSVRPAGGVYALLKSGEKPEFALELPRFAFAPTIEGESAGKIIVSVGGEVRASGELVYAEDVKKTEGLELTPWERFLRVWALAGKQWSRPYYLASQ